MVSAKQYPETYKPSQGWSVPPMEVAKYNAVGCLFCNCSYHSLGANNIGPYISAGSDLWLAVYPDQVAISAYFIPRAR